MGANKNSQIRVGVGNLERGCTRLYGAPDTDKKYRGESAWKIAARDTIADRKRGRATMWTNWKEKNCYR